MREYDAETMARLSLAMGRLEELERTVLQMRFGLTGEVLTVGDIARRLGKPEHVVQAAQRHALTELRSSMMEGRE